MPVILVFSSQINQAVLRRYRNDKLLVLVGQMEGSTIESTYSFCNDIIGFDIIQFFQRNSENLRGELAKILDALLSPS